MLFLFQGLKSALRRVEFVEHLQILSLKFRKFLEKFFPCLTIYLHQRAHEEPVASSGVRVTEKHLSELEYMHTRFVLFHATRVAPYGLGCLRFYFFSFWRGCSRRLINFRSPRRMLVMVAPSAPASELQGSCALTYCPWIPGWGKGWGSSGWFDQISHGRSLERFRVAFYRLPRDG